MKKNRTKSRPSAGSNSPPDGNDERFPEEFKVEYAGAEGNRDALPRFATGRLSAHGHAGEALWKSGARKPRTAKPALL